MQEWQKLQVAGIAQLPVPVISTAMVAMEVTINVVDVVEVEMVDVVHVVEVPLPNCPVVEVLDGLQVLPARDVVEVQVDGEKVADKISFRK